MDPEKLSCGTPLACADYSEPVQRQLRCHGWARSGNEIVPSSRRPTARLGSGTRGQLRVSGQLHVDGRVQIAGGRLSPLAKALTARETASGLSMYMLWLLSLTVRRLKSGTWAAI